MQTRHQHVIQLPSSGEESILWKMGYLPPKVTPHNVTTLFPGSVHTEEPATGIML